MRIVTVDWRAPRPLWRPDYWRADLANESETIRQYRERLRQCEALGEYAIAEDIREILRQEQEHLVDLATALGEDAPDLSRPPDGRAEQP